MKNCRNLFLVVGRLVEDIEVEPLDEVVEVEDTYVDIQDDGTRKVVFRSVRDRLLGDDMQRVVDNGIGSMDLVLVAMVGPEDPW